MFFCRQLPSAYVYEYLMNQEHLSLIRFFHHASIHQFFEPHQNEDNKNKWCVFTRTSGELLRLHTGTPLFPSFPLSLFYLLYHKYTDAKLQELLVLPLLEKDGILEEEDNLEIRHRNEDEVGAGEEMISTVVAKRMQVISLQSIPSTRACENLVAKFVKSKTRRIVSKLSFLHERKPQKKKKKNHKLEFYFDFNASYCVWQT